MASNCPRFFPLSTLGTKAAPFPIPDPRVVSEGVDVVSLYPKVLQELMGEEVKVAIRKTHSMKAVMKKDSMAKYAICPNKLERAPYDDFLAELCQQFGTNQHFNGGPQRYSRQLMKNLEPYQEHLFGMVGEQLSDAELYLLPRNETLKIDDKYYQGRHTHREFLSKSPDGLLAAGTLMVDAFHLPKFNFRTGHFMVHTDEPKQLAQLRQKMLRKLAGIEEHEPVIKEFQFWSALPYDGYADKPKHSVFDELLLSSSESPGSMQARMFTRDL